MYFYALAIEPRPGDELGGVQSEADSANNSMDFTTFDIGTVSHVSSHVILSRSSRLELPLNCFHHDGTVRVVDRYSTGYLQTS